MRTVEHSDNDITIDEQSRTLTLGSGEQLPLYSEESFRVLSRLWVKVGWSLKYTYGFTWLGRPIIQLPEDLVRVQEAIYRVRPAVIVETGVAHGGSLIYYASLLTAMGGGRVVGVDIEIRPHNREALEAHELSDRITLLEGDAVADDTVARVKAEVAGADGVLVILDSNHSFAHVRRELDAYAPLVTPGSYVVVTDGVMEELHDVPGGGGEAWRRDNPKAAALDFLETNPEFELEEPPRQPFNEGRIEWSVTHWPAAYLRRTR
jgi:cephalosporin hydroxylase